MEIIIRAHVLPDHSGDHSDIFEIMAICPPSLGNWVSCDAVFTVPERLVETVHHISRYEVLFETVGTYRVNYDVTKLSFSLMEGPLDRLLVSNTIRDLWLPGAEILITSDTKQWNNHQVATIRHVEPEDIEPGMVEVLLNHPIRRPTTVKDNVNYAVEVVLLSRNIVFQGDGAHLVVMQTPNVVQTIQGAELKNFGQAGVRGRYPIHFDYCGDSSGSVISKNTIRKSNQRCIVLNGSNNVHVEGNVAFDTTGHCFVLESGTEAGNAFVSNIGAYTHNAEHLMPQYGVSGKETDDQAVTFWSTNPSNLWQGNVAAGSQGSGFSFQLGMEARGPRSAAFNMAFEESNEGTWNPSTMALTLFQDNVAHSNMDYGFKAQRLFPKDEQAVLRGFRSYLNVQDGLDVSETRNVAMVNVVLDVEWQPPISQASHSLRTTSDSAISVINLSVVAYPQDRTYHSLHNATVSPWDSNHMVVPPAKERRTATNSVPSFASVFHLSP
jgi:parallel beta-helix repeat protein